MSVSESERENYKRHAAVKIIAAKNKDPKNKGRDNKMAAKKKSQNNNGRN